MPPPPLLEVGAASARHLKTQETRRRLRKRQQLARALQADGAAMMEDGRLAGAYHCFTESIAVGGLRPGVLLARGACALAMGMTHAAQVDASLAILALNAQLVAFSNKRERERGGEAPKSPTVLHPLRENGHDEDVALDEDVDLPTHEHNLWHGLPEGLASHLHPSTYVVAGVTGEHDHTNESMDALDVTVRAFRIQARALQRQRSFAEASMLYDVCLELIAPWESVKVDEGNDGSGPPMPMHNRSCETGCEVWVWVEPLDFTEKYDGVKSIHKQAEWMRAQAAVCEREVYTKRAPKRAINVWRFVKHAAPFYKELRKATRPGLALNKRVLSFEKIAADAPDANNGQNDGDAATNDDKGASTAAPATPPARSKRKSFLHDANVRAGTSPTVQQNPAAQMDPTISQDAAGARAAARKLTDAVDEDGVMDNIESLHENENLVRVIESWAKTAIDVSQRYIRGNALQPKAMPTHTATYGVNPVSNADRGSVDFHPEDLIANADLCTAVWGYKQVRDVEVAEWIELPEWSLNESDATAALGGSQARDGDAAKRGGRIAQSKRGIQVSRRVPKHLQVSSTSQVRSTPHYNIGATVRPGTAPPEGRAYAYQARHYPHVSRRQYAPGLREGFRDNPTGASGRPNMYVHPWSNRGDEDAYGQGSWNTSVQVATEFTLRRVASPMRSLVLSTPRSGARRAANQLRLGGSSSLEMAYAEGLIRRRDAKDLTPMERAFHDVDAEGRGFITRLQLGELDAALARHGLKVEGDRRDARNYPVTDEEGAEMDEVPFGDFSLWWEEEIAVIHRVVSDQSPSRSRPASGFGQMGTP